MITVYEFAARTLAGKEIALSDFRGRVLLIVNTASRCGFTPQYEGLEALYREYSGRDFAVLGFPCNQFGAQEPGNEDEIGAFCTVNFGVTFPMFAKIDVNGPGAHPLYVFLTKAKRGLLGTGAIKWNFTKFLIGRDGMPVKRYAPSVKPEDLKSEILALL